MDITETSLIILMADDDEEDRMLTGMAFRDAGIAGEVRFVSDGKELMDYLLHEGAYTCPENAPRPDLILLDLNMPRKDGREALKDIKSSVQLKDIPVVIFTTSRGKRDVDLCYSAGACDFIVKPVLLEDTVKMLHSIAEKLRTDSLLRQP
jgi:CheY-like chemotaxis protein